MTRIVLVGAGSVEFTRNLLGDFLSFPELRDATIVLHDIDAERLRTAERMAAWTATALGAEPIIEAHLDRRTALQDADIVVDTIQVAGARATQIDFDIPARYGLRYTVNDTTVGALVSCSMAAFAFAVLPFRGKGLLFALIMATLIIPFQVGAWLGGAFGIFLIRQFFLTVPRELADAARVDGANPWRIYRHIYLPLARPVLATLAIFTFMWTWNDLLSPLIYLRDLPDYTTTVGLAFFQGQHLGKWPEMMAGAMVSLVPMVALFVLAQQYFVRGIAISGLKG